MKPHTFNNSNPDEFDSNCSVCNGKASDAVHKPTQPLTQLEFNDEDFDKAEAMAKHLGYEQTAYTSSSALWGLFCLPENPATWHGSRRALEKGCIIKTHELGLLFVQYSEDLGLDQ